MSGASRTSDNRNGPSSAARVMDTYYALLDVPVTATRPEITRAYRLIMKRWHPDRVPEYQRADAEDLAKRLNEAYAVLSDPVRREAYDRTIKHDMAQAAIMNRYMSGLGDHMFVAQAPKRQMSENERREIRIDGRRANVQLLMAFGALVLVLIVVMLLYGLLGSLASALF